MTTTPKDFPGLPTTAEQMHHANKLVNFALWRIFTTTPDTLPERHREIIETHVANLFGSSFAAETAGQFYAGDHAPEPADVRILREARAFGWMGDDPASARRFIEDMIKRDPTLAPFAEYAECPVPFDQAEHRLFLLAIKYREDGSEMGYRRQGRYTLAEACERERELIQDGEILDWVWSDDDGQDVGAVVIQASHNAKTGATI